MYILEDKDRQLQQNLKLETIQRVKVPGKTAIPTGRYEIVITMSSRFKRKLPLLLNVPGFSGIRIHSGNHAGNTEGCLLPGTSFGKDYVNSSRIAFESLFKLISKGLKAGKVFITIV
jgi:hypothetical protein